jgi:hypothetical protein
VDIVVQVGPRDGAAPKVTYRWDPDTDILSAQLRPAGGGNGASGSVEVQGADGSWIMLGLVDGRLDGLEVVVWPEVRKDTALAPPASVEEASIRLPSPDPTPGVTALEVETPMAAESDPQERIFHFRLGPRREARAVRVAHDLLLEVDARNRLAGLWLLNVPPFPQEP